MIRRVCGGSKFKPLIAVLLLLHHVIPLEITNTETRLTATQLLNQLLPEENRIFLEYLLKFLSNIASQSSLKDGKSNVSHGNLMTSSNLAIVFGPNILRSKEGPASSSNNQAVSSDQANCSSSHFSECVEETENGIDLVVLMIDNAENVCKVPEQIQRDMDKLEVGCLNPEAPFSPFHHIF